MADSNPIALIFRIIGGGLDLLRKTLHLVILLIVFLFVAAAFAPTSSPVPASAALLVAPSGTLVDQLSGDPVSRALDSLGNQPSAETLARDLVDAIDAAADDDRIKAIALDLRGMGGAGLTKLQRVAEALERFKETEKPIIAYGDFFSQGQYLLASHADELFMHPSGGVFLQGFGRYRTFYADAIDKLSIDWNVFRVGEFKSFVEPYIRDDMSPEDRSSSRLWLGQLWSDYLESASTARELDAAVLPGYAEGFDRLLADNGGDFGKLALDNGLVDELSFRDEAQQRLIDLVGADDKQRFNRVRVADYLADVRMGESMAKGDGQVAVIVASGQILDGEQPPGTIGGDTLASVVRKARLDDDIKAVVLQIDSPGGSKFASEIAQRELKLLKAAGKPLVASMSSVAASGGYYIAMDADEIWARPTTITGSIGIGAYFPTFQRSLDRLGVHVDGVGTTPLAGEFRPDRPLGEEARSILQTNLEHGYQEFVQAVADARNMAFNEVDAIARGRVWTGADAHRLGLVDMLGGLEGAIDSAASRAGLGTDFDVRYLEKELTLSESFALRFITRAESVAGFDGDRIRKVSPTSVVLERLKQELARLASFNDPGHQYLFCDRCLGLL
ncbi:MAG: signal peptide peptidase SppA [Pseudomonadota bacterium]